GFPLPKVGDAMDPSAIDPGAPERDLEATATDPTSTPGTESEMPHKCDICSEVFALDFSGILEEDLNMERRGLESTAEETYGYLLLPPLDKTQISSSVTALITSSERRG